MEVLKPLQIGHIQVTTVEVDTGEAFVTCQDQQRIERIQFPPEECNDDTATCGCRTIEKLATARTISSVIVSAFL